LKKSSAHFSFSAASAAFEKLITSIWIAPSCLSFSNAASRPALRKIGTPPATKPALKSTLIRNELYTRLKSAVIFTSSAGRSAVNFKS
jgi:hypothetical protein